MGMYLQNMYLYFSSVIPGYPSGCSSTAGSVTVESLYAYSMTSLLGKLSVFSNGDDKRYMCLFPQQTIQFTVLFTLCKYYNLYGNFGTEL